MAEQQNPTPSDSDVQRILSTIKQVESSGNYEAKAKGSSASGAYQFINDTWQRSTKRYGIGTEYKTAAEAPPEVQDAVAARAVRDILGQVGGDVTKVPLVWYTGNPQGRMTEEALRVNRGLTPDKYQQKWLSVFNKGSPTATMAAQTPAQPVTQAPRTMAQATPVVAAAKPSLTDMPAAYRMALAANYLADTESPETSVVERAMEMLNEQQGGAAKNPLAGYMQAMGEESVNPFQFVQQEQEEPRRRVVPRMPVRMADGGPVYGVQTNPEVSIKNLQELVNEGQGAEPAPSEGPAASGYGIMADIGNSMVGLSQAVPGMATAALGMIGQAMVNHALAPFAEALSNEAVATAQANAASAVAQGLAAEAEGLGIGPGVGPGIAAAADDAGVATSSDSSDGPGDGGADGASGDGGEGGGDGGGEGFKHGGLASLLPRRRRDGSPEEGEQAKDPREQVERRMMYSLGPMDVRAVRKPSGYEARVSGSFNQVVPYMDFDPLTGTFRPTEVGVSYGQMGPEGGYQLRYGQPLLREGQGAAPPQVTGQYRRQLDRNSEVQASGYYVPIPGARDQYGAQFRYLQRFANGGDVVHRQAGSPQQGEIGLRTPSISEVPQVDVRGRVIRDVPVPQPTFTPGQQLIGAGETALSALSGLTAPASIAYDVLRGVPAKDVSPSRFVYEPRTEAGQETLQNVGRLAQEYKLDAALPQVQLQRPYPVGAAARQGIAGIEKGVEKMTLPTFRQLTGNPEATKEQMMDFVLNQKNIMQAGAPAAVKPTGGVVNADEMVDSLTRIIKYDTDLEKQDPQKFDDIFKWIDTKARNYYEKQFGSPSDPLFRSFLTGDFNPQFDYLNDSVRSTYEESIKHARTLFSSTSTANQRIGRAILGDLYDKVTPLVAQYGPQTIQNRLLNPKFREEIQRYIMEERNLGPTKLTPKAQLDYEKEIDSYLDEFAKTGKLSTKAPFDVVDINKATSQNIIDDIGNKVETQTAKLLGSSDEMYGFLRPWPGHGAQLEKTHALPSAYSKNYPDYLATTAERQAVKFGEPTYYITKQPEEVHADLNNLIGYLNRTPSDEWKNTSFPDLVVKAQKDYANITDPQEIYKRLNNYQKVTPKQRLIGTQEFMPVQSKQLGEGATWRELDENGILIEGRLLRHCLSEDEKYANFYKNGMSRFFALRDKDGKSYATIQIDQLGTNGPFANVHQIKGWKNNSVGKKYDKEIMDFLNHYQTKEINVPLRYTEESSFLPTSLAEGERVRLVEGDAPFIRRYVEFFRTLDRNLIDRNMATPEDLGDFNYVLDRMRDLPTETQQKEFVDTFLKAFGDGFNKPLKFIYQLGGWRTAQLGEPQPVWQNPPVNRAKGGMVDKPLYDRAA